MARFDVSGVDTVIGGLDDMISKLPELRDAILSAEADVIEPAIVRSARTEMRVRSGALSGSIERRKSKNKIRIGPRGAHHIAGRKTVESSTVGFVHEYGAPGRNLRAREWMSKAVTSSKSRAYAAAEKVYDDYIKNNT